MDQRSYVGVQRYPACWASVGSQNQVSTPAKFYQPRRRLTAVSFPRCSIICMLCTSLSKILLASSAFCAFFDSYRPDATGPILSDCLYEDRTPRRSRQSRSQSRNVTVEAGMSAHSDKRWTLKTDTHFVHPQAHSPIRRQLRSSAPRRCIAFFRCGPSTDHPIKPLQPPSSSLSLVPLAPRRVHLDRCSSTLSAS